MPKKRIWLYWLLGAMLTAAMFAALYRVGGLRYENSDDGLLLKAFMGFEGGTPANFSLYTHTALNWLMYGLSTVIPGVAWFSLFQLGVLLLSGTVLVKSMMQLAHGYRYPWLAGGLAGCAYLAVFAAFALCRINYTTTAALAAGAAVAQFVTVDDQTQKNGAAMRGYVASLLLLLCAYALRAQSALPGAAFIGLAFVWRLMQRARGVNIRLRPLVAALALFAVALGGMAGIRYAEVQARGLQPTLDWHGARTALMDYTPFETQPEPALSANSGLPATEVELVRQWYFMDANISARALHTMAAAYSAEDNADVAASLTAFFSDNPRCLYALVLLAALCLLCLLGERKGAPFGGLAALFALLGLGAMLWLLFLRGRVLGRAIDVALLPCAAMLFGLALRRRVPFGGRQAVRRVAAVVLCGLALAAVGLDAKQTLHDITRAPDSVSQQREADLEAFALDNPDTLVMRAPNLLRDTRLMPDVSAGIPGNIAIWGDWTCRMPSWYAQLEKYGVNGATFSAKDWLRGNVLFAAVAPEDTQALADYLTEAIGTPVQAEQAGEQGSLRFYRFRT